MQSRFRFKEVAVGGTFDVLHVGHEQLLRKAFQLGAFVFIGISGDALVRSLGKNHEVRPLTYRRRDLRRFLKAHKWERRARVIELKDPYGPAIHRRHLQAMVVSQATKVSGLEINSIRRTRKLSPLRLYVVRLVKGGDGKPVSTTRIRQGEIDVHGKLIGR